MSRLFFTMMLLSAAGVDRQPAAGIVCVCTAAVLLAMSKKGREEGGLWDIGHAHVVGHT